MVLGDLSSDPFISFIPLLTTTGTSMCHCCSVEVVHSHKSAPLEWCSILFCVFLCNSFYIWSFLFQFVVLIWAWHTRNRLSCGWEVIWPRIHACGWNRLDSGCVRFFGPGLGFSPPWTTKTDCKEMDAEHQDSVTYIPLMAGSGDTWREKMEVLVTADTGLVSRCTDNRSERAALKGARLVSTG